MNGDFGPNEWTLLDEIDASDDVLAFAGEQAEELLQVIRQPRPINAEHAKSLHQVRNRDLAYAAISMADDGYLFAAFDGARQRQRAHHRTHRVEQNVPGIAQPDELLFRHTEHFRNEWVESRINAGQGHDRQRVAEFFDMKSRLLITRSSAVIGLHDGFKQAHWLLSLTESPSNHDRLAPPQRSILSAWRSLRRALAPIISRTSRRSGSLAPAAIAR